MFKVFSKLHHNSYKLFVYDKAIRLIHKQKAWKGEIKMYEENQNNINLLGEQNTQGTENRQAAPEDIVIDNVIVTEKSQPKNKKSHKFLKKSAVLVASAAVFGLVSGFCFQAVGSSTRTNGNVSLSSIDEKDGSTEGGLSFGDENGDAQVVSTGTGKVTMTDFSEVIANVIPSIVAINCSAVQTQYDFFGRGFQEEVSGSGSGIIIGQSDTEILIATNNHVVSGAKTIQIVFDDESTAEATIKGTEPSSDLAVVAVKISDLSKETMEHIKIATLGDSEQLKVGEMAIAIGNALGYGQSSTIGWISALEREVEVDGITLKLLQTDAAINPGNSGGALLNARGEVIGINSVKYADTDVEGIGYAIPISDAIPILNDLMNREELEEEEKGYLGISGGKDITEEFSIGFNVPSGVYIKEIQSGSPAEAAGLHRGDIITKIKGRTVETMEDLRNVLNYIKAGTTVELTVMELKQGTYVEKTLTVTLGNRPTE